MSALSQLIENKALMFGAAAIAFFVAAVLVLLVFRLAFGRRLHMPGGRARQMRLGIVDAFDLDRQRQLVIVRRDNIEHLIMIGGPNDLLIESQIVRTEARGREKETRDREPTSIPAPPVKPYAAEPKLPIPPLAPEPLPAAATEASPIAAPLPGVATLSPGTRISPGAPAARRTPLTSAPPQPKPIPPEPVGEAPESAAPPPPAPAAAPGPAPKPAAPPQPGLPPAFTRWPARTPSAPTQSPTAAPKRPMSTPATTPAPAPTKPTPAPASTSGAPPAPPAPPPAAKPGPTPETPAAGPPVPSLEGLESLEEEMAKLLGRGPTKS